jgi:hypothetical protein
MKCWPAIHIRKAVMALAKTQYFKLECKPIDLKISDILILNGITEESPDNVE